MHLAENQIGTDAALDLVMTLKQFRQRRVRPFLHLVRCQVPAEAGDARQEGPDSMGPALCAEAFPWCRCGYTWPRTRRLKWSIDVNSI